MIPRRCRAMSGPIVRSAPNEKFTTNWEQAFAAGKPAKAAAEKKSAAAPKKKAAAAPKKEAAAKPKKKAAKKS